MRSIGREVRIPNLRKFLNENPSFFGMGENKCMAVFLVKGEGRRFTVRVQ